MGVSGCGKSTVGALLALRLRWEFEDADWFHPAANVDKMHSGIPLTDEDRWPWLAAVAAWIDKTRRSGGHDVIACSALKRRYRDVLIGDRADVRLVYLKGDEALIARRIATRHEHFMPRSLLHSQFEALEEPGPDENPIVVSIEPRPREIVAQILSALNMVEDAKPSEHVALAERSRRIDHTVGRQPSSLLCAEAPLPRVLIGDRADVRLVYLKGDETLIARRIATRHEHFMPPSLLHSQFEALEEPGPDENPVIVSIEPQPREIVAQILSALNMVERAQSPKQTSLRSSVAARGRTRKEPPMPATLSPDLLEEMPATLSPDLPEEMPATLSPDLLEKMDAYWRAANYLSVGQIYLKDNPLLESPLKLEHIKPRLLGHWGTTPGLNFLYVHLNRLIKENDLNMMYVIGPGHGGPGHRGDDYLEGSYTERYPAIERDRNGLHRLFRQFSWPYGVPSHVSPETPGSIHEGGELGYSLVHAYGAAFDNPDLIVACIIGDGEAETGALADQLAFQQVSQSRT